MTTYQCDHCGLCCKSMIIEAQAIDVLREPTIAKLGTLMDGHGTLPLLESVWYMGMPCIFYDVNKCSIYATRPGCCVQFQAGEQKCQDLRMAHGLPRLEPVDKPETVTSRIEDEVRAYEDGEDE